MSGLDAAAYAKAQAALTLAQAVESSSGAAALKAANLSDLASAATARTNLGLGSAATQATGAFDTAGAGTTAATAVKGLPLGLTGATAATRFVGATVSGAPASGTFAKGDFAVDQTGQTFVCTVAGTPGTWVGAISGANTVLGNLSDAGTARWNLRVPSLGHVLCVATTDVALSGLQTIDGYTLTAGDRVLLTGQTTGSQNGPWVAAVGSWTRPTDYPSGVAMPARSVMSLPRNFHGPELWISNQVTTALVDSIATTWRRLGWGALKVSETKSASSSAQLSHEFDLAARKSVSLDYAAAFVRSTAVDKPTAFDVMPSGTGYVAGNGFSWFDACDEDVDTTGMCAVARLGIDTDHAFVGAVSYKTGPATNSKPFYVRVPTSSGGGSTPAMKFMQALNGLATADLPTFSLDPHVVLAPHGGSVIGGSGYELATNTQVGFFYLPQMSGAPTGSPPLQTAGYPRGWDSSYPYSQVGTGKAVPIVIDVTNSKLWARIAGTWKGVVLT